MQRPGGFGGNDVADLERKDAVEFCRIKHELATPKNDGLSPVYLPSSSEIEDATLATKALHSLFRHGNADRVEHKKSLSSLTFRSNQFVLAPEMSNRVLSCLVDPTDVAGLCRGSRANHCVHRTGGGDASARRPVRVSVR
jgi:hypothetical protein